jgi:hypothetical protein
VILISINQLLVLIHFSLNVAQELSNTTQNNPAHQAQYTVH